MMFTIIKNVIGISYQGFSLLCATMAYDSHVTNTGFVSRQLKKYLILHFPNMVHFPGKNLQLKYPLKQILRLIPLASLRRVQIPA